MEPQGHSVARVHRLEVVLRNLLGSPYAAKLGTERAYYRNEQWPTDMLDKFKPYALVSPTDVRAVVAILKDRWAYAALTSRLARKRP